MKVNKQSDLKRMSLKSSTVRDLNNGFHHDTISESESTNLNSEFHYELRHKIRRKIISIHQSELWGSCSWSADSNQTSIYIMQEKYIILLEVVVPDISMQNNILFSESLSVIIKSSPSNILDVIMLHYCLQRVKLVIDVKHHHDCSKTKGHIS